MCPATTNRKPPTSLRIHCDDCRRFSFGLASTAVPNTRFTGVTQRPPIYCYGRCVTIECTRMSSAALLHRVIRTVTQRSIIARLHLDAHRLKPVTRGSSNNVPGPIRDSFVTAVKSKQQHSVMAIRVKRCGTNGNSTMRRRHLFGYTAILVASFRRLPCSRFPRHFVGSWATSIDLVGSGSV